MRGRTLIVAIILAAWAPVAALAQASASYRLDEQALNAGGRPLGGQIATSASFRVTLDALGSSVGGPALLTSTGYSATVGLPAIVGPAGEIQNLRFTDQQTMTWTGDPAIGDYVVYRGVSVGLPGMNWGVCSQTDLTQPTTTDAAVPALGNAFVYLIGARNRLGAPGSLGTTTAGVARTPSAPCP